jgi:type IV secretory pathway VirB2 component (pilin)
MLKLYFLLLLLVGSSLQAEGVAGTDKATKMLESIIGIFTGVFLQGILALAIMGGGLLYVFGKGQEGRERLIQVIVGSAIILMASGITELIV